jgi:cbb3-type cytochrome oxidase maturation protein
MYAIFILVIISLSVAIGFLVAFLWAVKSNQYEDDYTPSVRILFDDEKAKEPASEVEKKEKLA